MPASPDPEWGWGDVTTVLRGIHWRELQMVLRLRQQARNRILDADTTNIIATTGIKERGGVA